MKKLVPIQRIEVVVRDCYGRFAKQSVALTKPRDYSFGWVPQAPISTNRL